MVLFYALLRFDIKSSVRQTLHFNLSWGGVDKCKYLLNTEDILINCPLQHNFLSEDTEDSIIDE